MKLERLIVRAFRAEGGDRVRGAHPQITRQRLVARDLHELRYGGRIGNSHRGLHPDPPVLGVRVGEQLADVLAKLDRSGVDADRAARAGQIEVETPANAYFRSGTFSTDDILSYWGQGIGKALLGAVIAACEGMGLRQMVAMIGDSGNAGSIGLHRAMGFEPAGVLPAVGYKHGRWVDVIQMRRALNAGSDTDPDSGGLPLEGR